MESTTTTNNNNNNNNNSKADQRITGTSLDEPADCTIACDEGHITAHKLVLCDHSKYLHDILIKYPTAEHPIIVLTDLNIIDIKTLVNYMYTGELVITNDSSPTSLLRAAQILKIDSLTADDDHNNNSLDEDGEDRDHSESGAIDDEPMIERDQIDENLVLPDSQQLQQQQPPVESKTVFNHLADIYNQRLEDLGDDDDDDEDAMLMDGDDQDNYSINHMNNSNDTQRLINSIKNIYSLEKPLPSLGPSTPGSSSGNSGSGVISHNSQQQLQQQLHHNNNNNNNSNTGNSNTPTLSQLHMQRLTNNLVDLQDFQDFQDSKQSDNKNNKIRCHLCNIGLSDVKCLYRHVLTRHLPEKWGYKCEFCDREFSRDDHLMRHYTTKHKNMDFNREKIRETRRLNREMAKNFHDRISTV